MRLDEEDNYLVELAVSGILLVTWRANMRGFSLHVFTPSVCFFQEIEPGNSFVMQITLKSSHLKYLCFIYLMSPMMIFHY